MKNYSGLTSNFMKKIGRSLAFILTLTVLLCSFAISAIAEESPKAMLSVSQNELKPNDEFVLSVSLDTSDIDLLAYTARLSYDKNVFETVSVNSFEEKDNWSDITYNAGNQKFVLINKSGTLESSEMLQITMRVKDNAAPGKTSIMLQEITASNGNGVIEIDEASVEVLVIREELAEGESIPVDKSFADDFKDGVVTVKQSKPWVIAVIAVLFVLAVVFLVAFLVLNKRRGYTAKKRNAVIIIDGTIIAILFALLLCMLLIKPSGDVNGDGQVNYNDTQQIIDYLLDIQSAENNKADVNGDGQIDVDDVAQSVDKVKPSVTVTDNKPSQDTAPAEKDPEVKVSQSSIPYFANKGETVTLKLNISAQPKMDAKYIEIKGKQYKLRKTGENTYEADITAPKEAGIHNFTITSVVLENGKKAKTNFVIAVDVLKDKPEITGFRIDNSKEIPEIGFKLSDPDGAFKRGYVIVTDENGAAVLREDITANENLAFGVRLEDGKNYHFEFIVTHDRDHDYFNTEDKLVADETIFERDLTFTRDFNFIASDFAITEKVTADDELVLTFKNGYDSYYKVSTVVIDGVEYPAQGPDENGVYTVVIPKAENKGEYTITVEAVTLENDTTVYYPVNEELTYIYLKDAPAINGINVDMNGDIISVSVDVTDEDGAIEAITVVIRDKDGNVVKEVALSEDGTVDIPLEEAGEYTVEVVVAYDLGDHETQTLTEVYEDTIKKNIKITEISASMPAYVERGESVEVFFTIVDNTEEDPSYVLINGVKAALEKQADGTYKATFIAPAERPEGGIAEYEAIRVYYGNEEVDVDCSFTCEILKLAPSVTNTSIDDTNTALLHFDLVDDENSFISGRVIVTEVYGDAEYVYGFERNDDLSFDIELSDIVQFVEYKLQIELTYDLDNDKNDGINLHTEIVEERTVEILKDYDFTVSNYRLKDITNDTVTLEFTSTNASKYAVQTVTVNGKEYPAQNNGNVYTVSVPAEDFGKERTELVLEKAVLENLKAFTEELSDLEAVLVFKTIPTAVITGATISSDKTAVTAYYDITDNDSVISISYIALLMDNEIIAKAQSAEDGSVELKTQNGRMLSVGEYTIEVIASFDAVDGLVHSDENITMQPRIVTVDKQVIVTDIQAKTVYPEKGAEDELIITVESNTSEKITEFEINGNKYSAEKVSENAYKVTVNASEAAGFEEFTASKAYFADEETAVAISAGVTVDVLKDVLVINNGFVDTDSATPVLRFDLIDADNAFISGQIAVESKGRETLYFDFEKPEDSSTIEILLNGVAQNVIYTVKANVTYDLDSSEDDENRHTKTIAQSIFEWIADYEFTISNLRLEAMDEEWITLKFTSHNDSNYGVNKVVINGIEYYVDSRAGNEYTVKVPVSDIGESRTVLGIEKATLENLKAFEGDDLNGLNTVVVFKTKPQAIVTDATVSENLDRIDVVYDIIDPDETLGNAYVVIENSNGIYIKIPVGKDQNNAVITPADSEIFKAGRYTVAIIADYDRADGLIHREENITAASYPISIMKQVEVVSVEADKYYYEKGGAIELTVEISGNVEEPVQYFKLSEDNTLYVPEAKGDGAYKITVPALNEAGVKAYEVTRIDYADEMVEITDSPSATVEVLKSAPTLDTHTIKIDDAQKIPTLSFEISDTDDTFKSGKVIIKQENATVKVYEFSGIAPQIELEGLKEFVVYTLDIQVTYDLDEDKNDTVNVHTEYLEKDNEFEILGEYDFDLLGLKIVSMDTETITLGFTSTNKSRYKVQSVVINEKAYPVTSVSGNEYTVEVPVEDTERVKQELKLTEATLSNLKSFTVENAAVWVFLDAPKVTSIISSVNENTINIEIEPIDTDQTITNLYVTLLSVMDKATVEETAVKVGDKYTASFNVEKAEVYDVIITADYNRVDGETHAKERLYKAYNISGIPITATVVEVTVPQYIEKNGAVDVTFRIEGNTDLDVVSAKINGADAERLTKQGDYLYTATVIATSDFGNATYKVTEITFANDEAIAVDSPEAVTYVLKQAPTVGKYEFNDSLDIPEITIRIDDPDNTLLDETITLNITEVNGKSSRTETIKPNVDNVIQSTGLLQDYKQKFILTIDGLYDLDDVKDSVVNSKTNTYNVKDVLGEREIELLDYEVHFETVTVNGVNASENTVTVSFTVSNNTEQNITEVLVDGGYYSVQGPDAKGNYTATVPYTPNGGERVEVTLEGVKLANGRIVAEPEDSRSFEIFLDGPSAEISDIAVADNLISITADFSVTDKDDTITTLYAVLKSVSGKEITRKAISKSDTTVTLNVGGSGRYIIEITADYDRFDGAEHVDETLATSAEVEIDSVDILELKDIKGITLYRGLEKVDMLDITGGIPEGDALQEYYVKIQMEHLPEFYASVEAFKLEDGKLIVVPDEAVFMQYLEVDDIVDELAFEISYKDGDGEHKLLGSAKEFFDKVAQNYNGTYTLTEDLDASDIAASSVPIINGTFTGTINGNGHKIVNLTATMFRTLNNATIDNLIIENANIDVNGNMRGIIATSANGSTTINNVHIVDSKIIRTNAGLIEVVGGFVGDAANTTKIRNCSAINVSVKTDTQAGGIAGKILNSVVIENCYATGTVEATFNNPVWGARAAGIVAWDNSTGGYVDNCYANVKIVVPNPIYSGGLVGGSDNISTIVIKNSFAINTGGGRKVIGFDLPETCKISNIWETNIGTAISGIDGTDRIRVTDDLYNKSFYQSTLKFDFFAWNFDLVDSNRLPNLINDPLPNDGEAYEILENANGIPNYNEIRNHASYRSNREIAYYNVSKIAPFATVNEWVNIANGITYSNLLSEKIETILAFDTNGDLLVGIRDKDAENLSSIKVFYESGNSDTFNVTYLRIMGGLVAEYEIKDLGVKYQFDSYVAKFDDSLVEKLVGWAQSYDYSDDIAATTPETESRLYVDYYNETLKSKLETAIINYLLTYTDYPVYFDNPVIQKQIADSITENTVKRLLYAYNYYDKWYNINLESVSLSNLLFFKGTVFGKELTTKYLIDSLNNATSANRDTNATYSYYNSALQSKTGKTFIEFLEYTFRVLDGYSDYNEWFKDHFKGILVEQPSLSANADEIKYRIWDLMSSSAVGDRRRNILPILTAPQEDMYLISIPSQIVIGSLLRYNDWIKGGEDRVEVMTEKIKSFGVQLGHLYGTMANLIEDSPAILNNHVHFQYDSRFGFPESEQVAAGTQDKGTTQDPIVKWVFEAVNQLAAANGSGAYANGTDVWWVCYAALDGGDFTYFVFAHETAHNQDGYYFYDGKGRRVGTGPESHSDDNYGMATGDESIMFNIFRDYDFTADISNNFSYTRIDSPEEIKDFYFDIFETKYAIDYMMAQAFLKLSAEEQAKVAVQVSHTPSGNTFGTTYSRITADKIEAMNLDSIEDLMNNNLALHSVGTVNSASAGAYGQDSFFNVYWYQPFNNDGAPDAYVFRRNGREMLGIGGYMDGYVAYMSGNKTDLDALRIATKNPTITWEEYKMDRYNRVASQLGDIPYFDYQEMIDQFVTAFRTDAKTGNLNESTNMQKVIYGLVKRATNDFTDGTFFEAPTAVTQIHNAQELLDAMNKNPYGNYKLVEDIDFKGITPAGGSYYVENTFVGILDGNGHTINGLQYPLCNSVAYAQFKNVTISAESYNATANAYLAKTAKRSTINGVTVVQADMMLPYFYSKNVCYEYGDNSVAVAEYGISSVEEFIAIGSSDKSLKRRYVLTKDIDFSAYTATNTSVIMGTFSGNLDGQGHTISGLNKASLFNNFQGTVENLVIRDFTNERNAQYTASFAAQSGNATFKNMYFDGIKLLGWQNTAPLSGYDKSSVMEQITVVNTEVKSTSYYASLLVARKSGGRISDCYIEGKLNMNSTQLAGVVGELMDGGIAENTISNVEVTRRANDDNRNLSGGFVGSLYNNAVVKNSIAMGNMIGTADGSIAWRFTASDYTVINSKISNSFELQGTTGKSSINENVTALKEATVEQIHTDQFWRDTLKLSESIWDFDSVGADGHPMLKHNGLNTLSSTEANRVSLAEEENDDIVMIVPEGAIMEEATFLRAIRDLRMSQFGLKK